MKTRLSADAISGLLLITATIIALTLDNSSLAPLYDSLLNVNGSIAIGDYSLSKPILLWINEGLMAIFFLMVGLEIKKEIVFGQLSDKRNLTLPGLAAVGGMFVPAAIYVATVSGDPTAIAGWAIPSATDIAFAIGILAFLSNRVPPQLKIFLLTVAILDDLGAVIVIAAFYTSDLSLISLLLGSAGCVFLYILNRLNVRNITTYMLTGAFIWLFVLKSGVHATLAGVAVGLAIPAERDKEGHSLIEDVEHSLHAPVSFFILPLFALANAGVSLLGVTFSSLAEPITLAVILGLVIGKPLGIIMGALAALYLFKAPMPEQLTLRHIWGAGHLAGIGFTMSLFIGSLAFTTPDMAANVRIGVLAASLISAIAGWYVLSKKSKPEHMP